MTPLSTSRTIAAPVERVFAAATDLENAASRVQAITRTKVLTPGPLRVGTRYEETRVMFGREHAETMEVSRLEPPRLIAYVAESHGCRYHCALAFDPIDEGTRVTMTFRAEPLTFVARILTVLMGFMTKRMVKECAKDLDDLAAHCEGRAAA